MAHDTLAPPASAGRTGPAAGPVLWLVRHGESTWNALGLAQGHCDQPRLTALAAALGLDITRDVRLRERSLGILEGTAAVAVPAALSGVAGSYVIDPDAWPPDGESLRDLYRRVADFADDLLATGAPGEVAVVAHGGTLRVLTAYLRGVPVERMSWEPVANGSVVRLPSQPPRLFTRKEYR